MPPLVPEAPYYWAEDNYALCLGQVTILETAVVVIPSQQYQDASILTWLPDNNYATGDNNYVVHPSKEF